jgi:hypothetical protein
VPQSRTNFDDALKELYEVGLRNAINETSFVLQEATRRADRVNFQGREAVWAVHVRRSNSTGARAELGTVPDPDRQGYDSVRERTRTVIHTIKLSREVIASSRSSMGAFVNAMSAESRGAEVDLKNQYGRMIYGQGRQQTDSTTTLRTGVIANVAGAPAGNVITLDNIRSGVAESLTDGEMRYFFVGMKLDAIDPADGSVEQTGTPEATDGMEITALDFAARTITVSDATGVADNDWIVVHGNYNNEFPGLRVLINDNTGDKPDGTNTVPVHGLSSATEPLWQSQVVGSTTTPISEIIIDEAFDAVLTDGDGEGITDFLGPIEQRRTLANQLQAQKRFDGRMRRLVAGFDGLDLARGTFIAERYCPGRDLFGVNWKQLLWFVLEDFQWDQEDGKVLFKTSNQLAYEARYFGMHTLGVANRNSHVRVVLELPA